MRIKDVKDLNLKTRWSDDMKDNDDIKVVNDINGNGDMKVVNDMKDLGLKVLWSEILICLRRLQISRAKKLMIESKSNEKKKWLDSRFKTLLLSYILNSIFDNIIIIALSNRMLNDPKFDTKTANW